MSQSSKEELTSWGGVPSLIRAIRSLRLPESIHNVLKNDLAAGVLPSNRFGANAAWLRLAVLRHNVLTALKRAGAAAGSACRPPQAQYAWTCSLRCHGLKL